MHKKLHMDEKDKSLKPELTGNNGHNSETAAQLEIARLRAAEIEREDKKEAQERTKRKTVAEIKAKRIANLKMWQPGQSGNPSGRPKRKPFTQALEKYIEAHPDRLLAAIDHLFSLAGGEVFFNEGSPAVAAAKLIMEKVEGKLIQPISGPGGGPIQHEHNLYNLESLSSGQLSDLEELVESAVIRTEDTSER